MNKRILIFSTAYFPFIGGAEVAVKEITDRLPDFEFVMITAKLDKKLANVEKIGNIEVHRFGKGDKWDKYRLILDGWKEAHELGKFDAVWSIMASYAGFAALSYKRRNPAVPFLLTLQEGDSRWDIYKHVWWCWPYFKQIFKRADKIQAISNYLANWAKSLGAKCSIEVVPNGVDIDKLSIINYKLLINAEKPPAVILAEAGIHGGKVVITVSRLVKKNGVVDLIKAMKFLDQNVHLLVAGEGILEKKLEKSVKKLNLKERIHFLGLISHNDLPKYLHASDVFCRPSLSEGLGNVFLEAMAAGVPVVGTKVGGIPDFLVDGETGLFCEARNSKNIAENIKKILEDIGLRDKLILNGKNLVKEKYSWNMIADKMKNIFTDL